MIPDLHDVEGDGCGHPEDQGSSGPVFFGLDPLERNILSVHFYDFVGGDLVYDAVCASSYDLTAVNTDLSEFFSAHFAVHSASRHKSRAFRTLS